jgi:phytoene synthase
MTARLDRLPEAGGLGARVTRQSGTSFYYAFLALPREKRRALYALYAFCRVVDDCVDDEGGEGAAGLDRWLAEIRRAYAGAPETELGRELAETVARFPVPRACFEDVVAGCRMDLATKRYRSFADLRAYCERVASAVGLASIEIFGYDDPRTREYATELGLALQLTNILRDVGTDAARGRLYLPLEDLAAFGVSEDDVLSPRSDSPRSDSPRSESSRPGALDRLLAFEADRARSHYAAAAAALPPRDRRSMLPAEIMRAIYRDLLENWARHGHPVGGERARLGKPRKLWLALRTVPRVYWGR